LVFPFAFFEGMLVIRYRFTIVGIDFDQGDPLANIIYCQLLIIHGLFDYKETILMFPMATSMTHVVMQRGMATTFLLCGSESRYLIDVI